MTQTLRGGTQGISAAARKQEYPIVDPAWGGESDPAGERGPAEKTCGIDTPGRDARGERMDFETEVKLNIYKTIAQTTRVPTSSEVARALAKSAGEVESAFDGLHAKRLLVPEPGDPSRIRMAPPFSGVKTDFRGIVRGKSFYANCVWDALGIAAALHQDGAIDASDAHTGERIPLEVKDGQPIPQACVIHFAVPVALWWEDILYT
jgi:hypothetical protein